MSQRLERAESIALDPDLEVFDAVWDGNVGRLREILEAHPDSVNTLSGDDVNFSALHYSCQWGHPPLVNCLLEFGASVELVDLERKQTPLHWAVNVHGRELPEVMCLLDSDKGTGYAQSRGSWAQVKDVVSLLLDHGAKIDEPDGLGRSSLHLAAKNGKPDVVEFLLAHNANPCMPDGEGLMPLDHATNKLCQDILLPAERRAMAEKLKALQREITWTTSNRSQRQNATDTLEKELKRVTDDYALLQREHEALKSNFLSQSRPEPSLSQERSRTTSKETETETDDPAVLRRQIEMLTITNDELRGTIKDLQADQRGVVRSVGKWLVYASTVVFHYLTTFDYRS